MGGYCASKRTERCVLPDGILANHNQTRRCDRVHPGHMLQEPGVTNAERSIAYSYGLECVVVIFFILQWVCWCCMEQPDQEKGVGGHCAQVAS